MEDKKVDYFSSTKNKIIMQQIYHSNAKTNVYIREQIQNNCSLSVKELAQKYSISVQTASKWKNRNAVQDASSAPNKITYALSRFRSKIYLVAN
jgi:DNA-binding transcriptional regulator YiaG